MKAAVVWSVIASGTRGSSLHVNRSIGGPLTMTRCLLLAHPLKHAAHSSAIIAYRFMG